LNGRHNHFTFGTEERIYANPAAIEKSAPMPPAEENVLKMDGTVIDVEVQDIPIEYDGVPAVLAARRDTTRHRHAEACAVLGPAPA
jgi:hypothetical protein